MNKLFAIAASALLASIFSTTTFAATATQATTETPATEVQTPPLTVTSAIARPSMEGSKNSAAYVTLHNNSANDITITSATSFAIANHVELHTVADTDGVKKMVKVNKLVVPAGGDLVMQKGGIHIMLMNLKKTLKVGDKFDIEINTQELGLQTVTVEVVQM